MRLLADTHLLIWMTIDPQRLSRTALLMLGDRQNEVWFSAISVLEMAIMQRLNKLDLRVTVSEYRDAMLQSGLHELTVVGRHAAFVSTLPPVHRDPFDRLLVAQATVEGMLLLTADEQVAQYSGPILRV